MVPSDFRGPLVFRVSCFVLRVYGKMLRMLCERCLLSAAAGKAGREPSWPVEGRARFSSPRLPRSRVRSCVTVEQRSAFNLSVRGVQNVKDVECGASM